MTGVDPIITRLCATISSQLYEVRTKSDFDLAHQDMDVEPELLLFDNHGIFESTNPPFAAVIVEDALILGWRGSVTAMDWDRDFGFSVASSFRWKGVAKTVKVQGAYASLVENALTEHEDNLIRAIKERNIKEVILTGHSLGGGAAQVAHIFLQGQLSQVEVSPWKELSGCITVRTISFEGPMTTVFVESGDLVEDQRGKAFIEECGANMCTTVFSMDPVPRMYGMPEFAMDIIDNLIVDKSPISNLATKSIVQHILKTVECEKAKGGLQAYITIAKQFRHIGNVIFYKDLDATPVIYNDDGAKGSLQLRDIANEPAPNDVPTAAYDNRDFIINGPGLSYKVLRTTVPAYNYVIR